MTLGKNFSKVISSHIFIVVFNVRLEHGIRNIIILVDNDFEENFISQRFVKENDLISDLVKYMRKFNEDIRLLYMESTI
jgi:hypothetical protein